MVLTLCFCAAALYSVLCFIVSYLPDEKIPAGSVSRWKLVLLVTLGHRQIIAVCQ